MAKRLTTRARKKTVRKGSTPRKDRLASYLYVEVRGWFHDIITAGNSVVSTLDGLVSFDSIRFKAQDEEQAYQLGPALIQEQQLAEQACGLRERRNVTGHASGKLLNDYVVRL